MALPFMDDAVTGNDPIRMTTGFADQTTKKAPARGAVGLIGSTLGGD